jgi:CHAD domain-containing protein
MGSQSSECSFGAAILNKHLNSLQSEVEGVRMAADIEAIHRMRVASRRLRAALPLFADCFSKKELKSWKKQLQHLTSALGAARDADVQIELVQHVETGLPNNRFRPGLRRLRLRLSQHRKALQKDVDAVLNRLDKKDFFTQFDSSLKDHQMEEPVEAPFTHQLYQQCAAAILERLDAFLAFEEAAQDPDNSEQLHAMRIAAKKLRYTMESYLQLYPESMQPFLQAVKTCQELLGEVHDCDVWTTMLPDFIQTEHERTLAYYGHSNPMNPLLPGLRYFEENRIQERASQYADFIEKWQAWKSINLWGQLRSMLSTPLQGVIYPPAPAASEGIIEPA